MILVGCLAISAVMFATVGCTAGGNPDSTSSPGAGSTSLPPEPDPDQPRASFETCLELLSADLGLGWGLVDVAMIPPIGHSPEAEDYQRMADRLTDVLDAFRSTTSDITEANAMPYITFMIAAMQAQVDVLTSLTKDPGSATLKAQYDQLEASVNSWSGSDKSVCKDVT